MDSCRPAHSSPACESTGIPGCLLRDLTVDHLWTTTVHTIRGPEHHQLWSTPAKCRVMCQHILLLSSR